MIIAQHSHTGVLASQYRSKRLLPRRSKGRCLHRKAPCRAKPFGKQGRLSGINRHVIGRERPGGQAVQHHQRIHRTLIHHHFIGRVGIEMIAHALLAKILQQHQPRPGVLRQNPGAAHTALLQPLGHGKKGARVFMGRRRIHQHGRDLTLPQPKIAAERGITGQWLDLGISPASQRQKFGKACGQAMGGKRRSGRIWRGIHNTRPSQSAPGSTMALRPSSAVSRLIDRHAASWTNPPA